LEAQLLTKYKIDKADFILLEELIQLEQPYKAGKPWQFAGSFYYATTVLTTIGEYSRVSREKRRDEKGEEEGELKGH